MTVAPRPSTLLWEGVWPSLFFALMTIRILFFAAYRETVGTGELSLELPEPATVSDALATLWARGEPYDALPAAPVVAVNRAFATLQSPLRDGDELALVPPVAGG